MRAARTRFILAATLAAAPVAANACIWWGDPEAVALREAEAPTLSPAQLAFIDAAAVPGGGFALAAFGTFEAYPYGEVTARDKTTSPANLAKAGFTTMVDLTPSADEAATHAARAEPHLRFLHFGTEAEVPSLESVSAFSRLLSEPTALPVLVYAEKADALGILWALHLMMAGFPSSDAIDAARELGLDYAAEDRLAWHLRNGLLKDWQGGVR